MLDAAHEQELPADALVAESAPGQFEVNLHYVDDAVQACDHATLLKRLIKNMAYDHEMDTTFMAKPYHNQAGSGMHLHVSLVDSEGRNVFAGDAEQPNDMLRWAVGGLVATMNDAMALFCPNINSYRRFSPEYYVPSAATGAWTTVPRHCVCRAVTLKLCELNTVWPAPMPIRTC